MNKVKNTHNGFYELRIIYLCLHEYIDSFCGSVEDLFPLLSLEFPDQALDLLPINPNLWSNFHCS